MDGLQYTVNNDVAYQPQDRVTYPTFDCVLHVPISLTLFRWIRPSKRQRQAIGKLIRRGKLSRGKWWIKRHIFGPAQLFDRRFEQVQIETQ